MNSEHLYGHQGDGAAVAQAAERQLPDLPVLEEVPELSAMLGRLRLVDRLIADVIEHLILLQDTGLAEQATGVALEQWLAIVAGRTRTDRRMLVTATTACRRLPSLRLSLAHGHVTWAQLRAVACKIEPLPRHLDDRLDHEIARAIDETGEHDPDVLVRVIDWTVSSLQPAEDPAPREQPPAEFLHLQPRLDGSGGTVYGQAGPEAFARLDAHLDPGPPACEPTRERLGDRPDPDRGRRAARAAGERRLHRLIDLLETAAGARELQGAEAAGSAPPLSTDGQPSEADADGDHPSAPGSRPLLILRSELETLLSGSGSGQLLTHLAGGRMVVDAATARRIAQEHGADLRLVVTDQGRIVGVGRRQRMAPDWIDEALLALHDTCSAPGCTVAARAGHTDHAVPFSKGGETDVANCAPLCAHDNEHKDREGWRVTGQTDGTRRWHHPRTGLTVRTKPTTWRPPPAPSTPAPPGRTADPASGAGPRAGPAHGPRDGSEAEPRDGSHHPPGAAPRAGPDDDHPAGPDRSRAAPDDDLPF